MSKPDSLKFFLLNPEKSYILETNVLNYAMGSILKQKINKKIYSVIFYFRKFTDAEFNYEIYNKKLLIIIAIFKIFKYSVTIYSNYKNLI